MAKSLGMKEPARDRPEAVEQRERVDLEALERIICRDAGHAPARYVARADVLEDGE